MLKFADATRTMMPAKRLDEFCNDIMQLDSGTGFVGIADSEARIIGAAYRESEKPLLTRQEIEIFVLESVIRMVSRVRLENRLGKTVYETAKYEQVREVSIPLRKRSGITHIFVMLLDLNVDHDRLVTDRIIPRLSEIDV
jgi:hypothetical protein